MAVYLGNVQVSPLTVIDYSSDYTPWTRPAEWPDLDAIRMPDDFEGVYMTYENTVDTGLRKAGLRVAPACHIDVGYLDVNNEFVPLIPQTATTGESYVIIDYTSINQELYPYVIIRVVPANPAVHINYCLFGRIPAADTGTSALATCYQNNCVERKGRLPWCRQVSPSSTNYSWVTYKLKKDATSFSTQYALTGTNFAQAYRNAYSIEEIDFSEWDTSQWTITSLAYVFSNCYMLQYLNLSKLNTTKWKITNFSYTFSFCHNLKQLDLSFDTSNWTVSTLEYLFHTDQKLYHIYGLNQWDTSKWKVTTLTATWDNCYSLMALDIGNWNTTNWAVTSLNLTWGNCYALKELDLSGWDTSNWPLNSLGQTWYYCVALKKLKNGNWDTTNWKTTYLNGTWQQCYSLEELEATQWHLPKPVHIDYIAYQWRNLKEIDLSNWDVSNIGSSFFYQCYSLEKVNLSNLDFASMGISATYNMFSSFYCLKELDPPTGWSSIANLSSTQLSRGEIIKFFNNLVDRSDTTAVTITLGALKYELTTEDIAIATAKNYNVN